MVIPMAKERPIIDFKCSKCGYEKSYIIRTKYAESGECVSCGELTYFTKLQEYDFLSPELSVECPYCHSTNTKKISKFSKAGNVALFGIFSIGKVTKQWHCNNCKSDF